MGPLLGIAAAGLLVFALAPLQRAAERLANAAMPGVRPVDEMSPADRAERYREMLRVAWQDGTMSLDERRLLHALRRQLGLTEAQAEALEREVTRL